ncbi:hypothetical protein BpHYR1_036667 [Brachionus plicatilis]|uniref:Uncharacterized protein n=1 Tax=Brachionus plicatilis TaxID=10195 RepID=A0A3M7PTJ7_BRAPC|nr:hypothetical protein BpHYR1_036667 [Brachionus plicatilis]
MLNFFSYRKLALWTLRVKPKFNLFSFRANYIVSIANFEIENKLNLGFTLRVHNASLRLGQNPGSFKK